MDFQDAPVAVTPIDGAGLRVSILGGIHTNNTWLESELKRILKRQPKLVELDLSKNDYISSSGIGTLVWFRNELASIGAALKVTSVHPQTFSAFRFAGLTRLFGIKPEDVVKS